MAAFTAAEAASSRLKAVFPANVVTLDNISEYETELQRPWSQTCWAPAASYVHLSNVQELIAALAIVRETRTKFAIRTTGHNPNAGFSSADKTGIVLDIRQLQSKELGADGVARVGSGSTWGEVYAWLEEQKRSAIGARDQEVGLGGFLLGGGMGALPNLHGLGVDGVRNFEVLLADGRLVNANATENADLHRALKGGGSNFGIVTRFDLETHPLINVQYTINLYSPEDYVEIIKATISVQKAMENDPKIGFFTNFNDGFVAVGLLYGDTPTERPQAFEPFYQLTNLMKTVVPITNGTLLGLTQSIALLGLAGNIGHSRESKMRTIRTVTTKLSQELYEEVYKSWTETCKNLPAGCILHFTIQAIGTAGVQAGKNRGGNIMGLESVPQCWWVFTCEWLEDGGSDAFVQEAVNTLAGRVHSLAEAKGLLLDFLGMTFAAADQKVLSSYGTDNVKMMLDTAAKYDPEGVFQELQHNGFLLHKSI